MQNFDSDPGWTGLRNQDTATGNDFGFSDSDFTSGASPNGEAGGTLARTRNVAFYADTQLGGVLTLDDRIEGHGEFVFTTFSAFNNGVFIGHRSAAPESTGDEFLNFLGITVAEAHGTSGFRFFAHIVDGSGGDQRGSEIAALQINTPYTWSYVYDPFVDSGRLTVEFFDDAGSVGVSTASLHAVDRQAGNSFDAFGFGSGGIGEASATNQIRAFIDDVAYSVLSQAPLSCQKRAAL